MPRILACEDLTLRFDLHRAYRRRPDVELHVVRSGWALLVCARDPSPDLVLLDHWLPDLLGDEIIERLRAQPGLGHTPVVTVAPDLGPEALARYEALPPVRVFTRLPSQEEVSAAINGLLRLERRRYQGFPVQVPLAVSVRGLSHRTITRDLSTGGASFDLSAPIAPEEAVQVTFDGAAPTAAAVVRRVEDQAGRQVVGVEFASAPKLERFLDDLLRDARGTAWALARIERLPALPNVVARVLKESDSDNGDLSTIIEITRHDPAIAACIIRLANSASRGVMPVATVDRAVTLIGLGIMIVRHLAQSWRGALARSFWSHSISTALAAADLALRFEMAPNEAFTLGLLHDIGRLVLHLELDRSPDKPAGASACAEVPSLATERESFGLDHAEAGAVLLERWRFPPSVHRAVGWHHLRELPASAAPQEERAVRLLQAADALTYRCHLGMAGGTDDGGASLDSHVRPEEAPALARHIFGEVARVRGLFGADVEPAMLCAEVVERANQRLAADATAAAERSELLRRAYERTRQNLTSLVQTEKYEALGRIAAGAAHEINNALAIATANVFHLRQSLMGARPTDTAAAPGGAPDNALAEAPEILGDVTSALKRIELIVDALGTFSRAGGRTRPQIGDPTRCVAAAVELAASSRPANVHVTVTTESSTEVLIDESGLVRAFLEIILNSFAAMPGGGRLDIVVRVDHRDVSVSFRDTGEGISEENLKRLFEPFFTTRPVGVGRGLGLSIAYGVVSRLHGRILISSQRGAGAVVDVRLPIEQAA